MKKAITIGLGGLAVLAVVILAILLRPRPNQPVPEPSTPARAAPPGTGRVEAASVAPSGRAATALLPSLTKARPVTAEVAGPAAAAAMVRVHPTQALATVQGVVITLKDLTPLTAEKARTEQSMSGDMYRFLLNRAIDREVVFQKARSAGVELSAEQRERLEAIRRRGSEKEAGVFDTVQQNPANAEFEARDSESLLLQAALVAKAGIAPPHVTAGQVEEYYRQHRAEYAELPADPAAQRAAWQKIDQEIRGKLAPQVRAAYEERAREYLGGLKASAKITIPVTSP
jgi:hypothetical protein